MPEQSVMPIPRLGLGTDGRTGEAGLAALRAAIELGYRHLDTAQTYNTEANVGRAVAESGLPRASFFITTKVANFNLARGAFLSSLQASLDRLCVERVDLTLVHWPSPGDKVPLEEYLEAAVEARAQGLTRLIGVSNFTVRYLERAIAFLGEGVIATNQVELHPYLQQPKLLSVATAHGIPLTAYLPVARGRVAADAVLNAIGDDHGVPATTVALAWLLQRGAIVIPASGDRKHLAANFAATTVKLNDDEMSAIAALDRGLRIIDPPGLAPAWD
jgi:2,5-diketo-D-gluconate reductase B